MGNQNNVFCDTQTYMYTYMRTYRRTTYLATIAALSQNLRRVNGMCAQGISRSESSNLPLRFFGLRRQLDIYRGSENRLPYEGSDFYEKGNPSKKEERFLIVSLVTISSTRYLQRIKDYLIYVNKIYRRLTVSNKVNFLRIYVSNMHVFQIISR